MACPRSSIWIVAEAGLLIHVPYSRHSTASACKLGMMTGTVLYCIPRFLAKKKPGFGNLPTQSSYCTDGQTEIPTVASSYLRLHREQKPGFSAQHTFLPPLSDFAPR